MSAHLDMLDQELADTLEAVRRKRGLPPLRAPVGELARDIVGAPRAPKTGTCCYCGTRTPGHTVCSAHEDLIEIDGATSAVVTTSTQTNGRSPHSSVGKRAASGRGGEG